VEVGTESDPLCLNHNAKAADGAVVGKNIIVNYKDADGVNQADRVAYLSDVNTTPPPALPIIGNVTRVDELDALTTRILNQRVGYSASSIELSQGDVILRSGDTVTFIGKFIFNSWSSKASIGTSGNANTDKMTVGQRLRFADATTVPVDNPNDYVTLNDIQNNSLVCASATTAGVVKVGSGLTVSDGALATSLRYSTDEVLTGDTWIDGKPIYRKVCTGTITADANVNSTVSLLNGVDKVIRASGYAAEANATGNMMTLPFFDTTGSGANQRIASVFTSSGTANLTTTSGLARTDTPYAVILEYTKA
jgi:hypothetical protein